ncbi:unnamed protein product, partial [Candidula unifasciata]
MSSYYVSMLHPPTMASPNSLPGSASGFLGGSLGSNHGDGIGMDPVGMCVEDHGKYDNVYMSSGVLEYSSSGSDAGGVVFDGCPPSYSPGYLQYGYDARVESRCVRGATDSSVCLSLKHLDPHRHHHHQLDQQQQQTHQLPVSYHSTPQHQLPNTLHQHRLQHREEHHSTSNHPQHHDLNLPQHRVDPPDHPQNHLEQHQHKQLQQHPPLSLVQPQPSPASMTNMTPPLAQQYSPYPLHSVHHRPSDIYYDNRMLDCKPLSADACQLPQMPPYYYPQQSMPDPSISPNGYNPSMPNPACMSGIGSPNMPVYPWMRQTSD